MQWPTMFGDARPKQNVYLHVRNADSTTISRGAPAVFNMNGTNDGVDVVQSSTAGANKSTGYFAGVVQQDIPAGANGLALCYGVADFVRCSGSVAVETSLSVNPAANNFVGGATVATIIGVASVGPAVIPVLVNAIATATVAGVSNVSARTFVRAM